MEENRTWSEVGGVGFADPSMPYLRSLAQQCTTFADWTETNQGQNSLTQYIGLTSGADNPRTVDDCAPSSSCTSTDDNIFRQVRVSGGTPRSFVEGATSGCSAGGNAAKHVPALYYTGDYTDATGVVRNDHDSCDAEVRPLTELDVDRLPTFAMISPNLCNDGHDCANDKVDAFAATWVSKILHGANYAAGDTAVMVLYDEDHPVPNLLIAPTANAGPNRAPGAGHAAMLKTWDEMLGLPPLQQSAVDQAVSLRAPAHI
ncbi:MAG: alkaline phosphatase family protein [Acidimicrobiales bacterium]